MYFSYIKKKVQQSWCSGQNQAKVKIIINTLSNTDWLQVYSSLYSHWLSTYLLTLLTPRQVQFCSCMFSYVKYHQPNHRPNNKPTDPTYFILWELGVGWGCGWRREWGWGWRLQDQYNTGIKPPLGLQMVVSNTMRPALPGGSSG